MKVRVELSRVSEVGITFHRAGCDRIRKIKHSKSACRRFCAQNRQLLRPILAVSKRQEGGRGRKSRAGSHVTKEMGGKAAEKSMLRKSRAGTHIRQSCQSDHFSALGNGRFCVWKGAQQPWPVRASFA